MSYKIDNNILTINNKIKKEFPNSIDQVFEDNNKFLISLTLDGNLRENYHRNIFLLDNYGQILWQVEAFNMGGTWSSIGMKNGKVKAFNSRGFYCEIDINTGKILSSEFTK